MKLSDQLQSELAISQSNVIAIRVTGLQSRDKFHSLVAQTPQVKAAATLLEANK